MHELGILSAMVKTIEKIAETENLEKIEKIVLEVGELSGSDLTQSKVMSTIAGGAR